MLPFKQQQFERCHRSVSPILLSHPDTRTASDSPVLGALSDTEEANGYLQEEIKQLLAEQDEQEELRNELHDQLKERGELMQMMARQAVSDSSTSTELLDRIRQLRLESELEKKTFTAEMDAIDAQLREIDSSDAQTQVRQGILDDVD